jgi:DNA-3-methyladenine glycosylase II
MEPIRSEADIADAVASLLRLDPTFEPIVAQAGIIPLRYRPPGYEGLASIIVSQMVSRASADAIWRRLERLTGGVSAEAILSLAPEQLRAAGLSGAKEKTLRGLAEACHAGLDLQAAAALPAGEAITRLTGIRGIGPWTSEVFLLFCAGHPDIFPAGDVALQAATAHAFALERRPDAAFLRGYTARWQPLRSIAARVLWAYYGSTVARGGMPVA